MADRGVVNAAEVLAGELRRKMGAIPADRVSRRQVTDLLASGDGGPVVIFPDRTVGAYPTLSEGERAAVERIRPWVEDCPGGNPDLDAMFAILIRLFPLT